MLQTDKMLTALQNTTNGLSSQELEKTLGSVQAVYTAAMMLRRKGHKLSCNGGIYVLKRSKSLDSATNESKSTKRLNIGYETRKTAQTMAPEDKAQFVEQMRLGFFHTSVAKSIADSYDYADTIEEAIR